jgi:hypothetical protein
MTPTRDVANIAALQALKVFSIYVSIGKEIAATSGAAFQSY